MEPICRSVHAEKTRGARRVGAPQNALVGGRRSGSKLALRTEGHEAMEVVVIFGESGCAFLSRTLSDCWKRFGKSLCALNRCRLCHCCAHEWVTDPPTAGMIKVTKVAMEAAR